MEININPIKDKRDFWLRLKYMCIVLAIFFAFALTLAPLIVCVTA